MHDRSQKWWGTAGLLFENEDALVDALGRITTIDRSRFCEDALERYLPLIAGVVGVGS